ncbi:helix-turn-helix domain-containing protein [Azospirillum picis]|uniref:HTH cro/C1-type domain-containing protein n=1 Tax=Azospirillum picis TaxID=488438 RepID=A0ABU0MST9_9PROT|nr:helix-turn-helix transcriptional regulator [Azospirillum picis]MBP2302779.1 hypothetical protein [Azospirillum picis]MDQ0536559.1 hypothetical protein [Azospirillum picis]
MLSDMGATAEDLASPEMKRLRTLLQGYMDRHGLSQRELSARIGPNVGLIKDILTIRPDGSPRVAKPRRDTLIEIARVVGLSLDEVWTRDAPIPDFRARPPLPQERVRDAYHRLVRITPVSDAVSSQVGAGVVDLLRVIEAPVDGGWSLSLAQDARAPLSLPTAYLEERIGVLAAHARHWRLASTTSSGLLRRGDDVVIDVSVRHARDAGLYAVSAEEGIDAMRLDDNDGRAVIGRIVWRAQAL